MPKSIKKKAWRFEMAKKGIRTVTMGGGQHGDVISMVMVIVIGVKSH